MQQFINFITGAYLLMMFVIPNYLARKHKDYIKSKNKFLSVSPMKFALTFTVLLKLYQLPIIAYLIFVNYLLNSNPENLGLIGLIYPGYAILIILIVGAYISFVYNHGDNLEKIGTSDSDTILLLLLLMDISALVVLWLTFSATSGTVTGLHVFLLAFVAPFFAVMYTIRQMQNKLK